MAASQGRPIVSGLSERWKVRRRAREGAASQHRCRHEKPRDGRNNRGSEQQHASHISHDRQHACCHVGRNRSSSRKNISFCHDLLYLGARLSAIGGGCARQVSRLKPGEHVPRGVRIQKCQPRLPLNWTALRNKNAELKKPRGLASRRPRVRVVFGVRQDGKTWLYSRE